MHMIKKIVLENIRKEEVLEEEEKEKGSRKDHLQPIGPTIQRNLR